MLAYYFCHLKDGWIVLQYSYEEKLVHYWLALIKVMHIVERTGGYNSHTKLTIQTQKNLTFTSSESKTKELARTWLCYLVMRQMI